jgi:hypothetical protein
MVYFREQGSGDLLWQAPMNTLPRPDDTVGYVPEGETEVDTWYKVEAVRFQFDTAEGLLAPGPGMPPSVPWVNSFAYFVVIVEVSVIP